MAQKLTTLVNTQAAIETAAEAYRVQIQKSSNFAWRSIKPLLQNNLEIEGTLDGQQKGRVAKNEQNLDVVMAAFNTFFNSVATPTTQKRIDAITNMFIPITTGIDTYYTNEIANAPISTINTATIETTLAKNNWIAFTNTIRFQVLNPVLAEWQNLLGTVTLTQFMKRSEYLILEKLVTYSAPVAHSSMQNHYRAMSSLYGSTLQLVWVKYVRETSSADRRPFCVAHESGLNGNRVHYHVNEITREWPQWTQAGYPKKGANWSGMIPGTGSENILINGGGFNCLHSYRFEKASNVSAKDRKAAVSSGAILISF